MKIGIIDYGYKKAPVRAHYNDAGADVFATKNILIPAHEAVKIPLGFGLRIPDGYMFCNYPKSGMASNGILSQIPPIDSGYTGEIHAILVNIRSVDCVINEGEKVAQLVMTPVLLPEFVPENELNKEERGANGFGSTGK